MAVGAEARPSTYRVSALCRHLAYVPTCSLSQHTTSSLSNPRQFLSAKGLCYLIHIRRTQPPVTRPSIEIGHCGAFCFSGPQGKGETADREGRRGAMACCYANS